MANMSRNTVWNGYQPPKGRCNYKTSLLSTCPCLRFMLHPIKAATSFECDGCAHHASFHSLDNPAEDAILKKWAEQQAEEDANARAARSNKRKRTAALNAAELEVMELTEGEEERMTTSGLTLTSTRANRRTIMPR